MKIVPLTLRLANDFVEKHHRHSARTSNDGGKYAIGLEHDGALVGVAIVGRPVAIGLQHAPGYPAELLRLCTSPECPKGGGSKLHERAKRIWQLMGGTSFHTYTLAKESGATMRARGLRDPVEVRGGRQWDTPSRRRERKAIYEEPKLRWDEKLPSVDRFDPAPVTFHRWARAALVDAYVELGWVPRPSLEGTNHGNYRVHVEWRCCCGRRPPEPAGERDREAPPRT